MFLGGDFDRLKDVQYGLRLYCTSYNLSKFSPKNTFLVQTFWGINPRAIPAFVQQINIKEPIHLSWYQYQSLSHGPVPSLSQGTGLLLIILPTTTSTTIIPNRREMRGLVIVARYECEILRWTKG